MNLHPWKDVCANAQEKIRQGFTVFQQWNCQHCGAKQTMPDANKFFELGICEECGKITDIKRNGMNLMTIVAISPNAQRDLPKLLEEIAAGKK